MEKRIGVGLLVAAVALGSAAAGRAQGLGEAERLAEAGRLEEAREIARAIAEGDGGEPERARALDLLGRLAVGAREFAAARDLWLRLRDEYPDSAPAADAAVKLALLDEILGAVPPGSAATAAPTPTATEPAATGAVLVAGDGSPPEVIEEVVAELQGHLRAAGVDAVPAPTELWWRRTQEMAAPSLLSEARRIGAASVVWIDFRFGHREKVAVRCFDRRGGEVWEERKGGGSGFTDHRKNQVVNRDLLDRVKEQVAEHVGDACLPTGP